MHKTFGCVRFTYNRMLAEKIAGYESTGRIPKITPAKYKTEFPFLKEVDSLALEGAHIWMIQNKGGRSMVLKRQQLDDFINLLAEDEKRPATIKKYKRDVEKFYDFKGTGEEVVKADIRKFKEFLAKTYKVSSANSILVAVNRFMELTGKSELQVKLLKEQKQAFVEEEKELTREEYLKLVRTARDRGNIRLSLLMQTLCATGIRVGEIHHITVEAVKRGTAEVTGKNKSRRIMIPSKLRRMLLKYVKAQKIRSGSIFITRNGNPMDRSNIWAEMKSLCEEAGVSEMKVFPHNLRHLFAKCFYELKKDLVKLADILGHSQIETTRIYTKTSGREHKEQINALNLLL